ncbi:MAG: hypothetical protein LBU34_11535 [Planctomycetaceae bacterium]|jgi:Tfp pilus assembly protein FimT|nr:hypothetical protein [Planctomycetaceae bacterium]
MKKTNLNNYRRTGLTLLELLIVLGLIVVIFSLGFSGFRRLHAQNQLKSTTQYLQNILYKTRLEAIKTGKAVVFRYQYDSPVFEILPKDLFDQREQSRENSHAIAVGSELLQESPSASAESTLLGLENTADFDRIYQKVLPNSIVFGYKQPETAAIANINGANENGVNENGQLPQPISVDHWSSPILFFPNGRTSQTTLVLRTTNRYHFQQELTLRGLTGTAKINK